MNGNIFKIDKDFAEFFISKELTAKAKSLLIFLIGFAEQSVTKIVEMNIERLFVIYGFEHSQKIINDIYNLSRNGIGAIELINGIDDDGYFKYKLSNKWKEQIN